MKYSLALVIFSIAPMVRAQTKHVPLFVSNGVFTRDSIIAEVLDTWQHYLDSRPDSAYDNPYWNETEKHRYPIFDLSSDVFHPNLYVLMQNYEPSVMSISYEKPYYKIRTLYASESDSGFANPLEIQEVFAKRDGGTFKLYNALPINTKSWNHETIGSITFIFPKYHRFDRTLATKMARFADSVASIAQSKPIPVDFYFANTYDELMKARGLDYEMGEGNASVASGMAFPKDRMLFGAGTGEWYPHELVHIYFNPKYPKANGYFLEGIAVMLGGSRGRTLHELLRHTDTLLTNDASIRFDSLLQSGNDNIDYTTGATYVVGGLLMQMAYDKGGWPLVKKMFTYEGGPQAVLNAIHDVFGVPTSNYDRFIKQKIREYARRSH